VICEGHNAAGNKTTWFLVINDTDMRTIRSCKFRETIMAFSVGLEFWIVIYIREMRGCAEAIFNRMQHNIMIAWNLYWLLV
jgi:hypothetical protein